MKQKKFLKRLGVGAALTGLAFGAAGCKANTPPPEDGTKPAATAPSDFDPSDMEIEDVYGPPVMEDEPTDEPDDFDPSRQSVETVYGPPEYFSAPDENPQPEYGPPPADYTFDGAEEDTSEAE